MKTTTTWLVIGFLTISNAVFALLYFTGDDPEATPVANTTEVVEEAEVAGATDVMQEAVKEVEVSSDNPDRSQYDAVSANFSLDLDPRYQVVVEKDGGSDELRSTILKIGRKGADENGTISLRADDYVKVEAYPSAINGTRDQFVTNDTALQGNFADEAASKVDGVQARKFTLEGVGKTVKYYFERDGITYFIESWDVSSGDTQVMVDDVVRGFSFN